jgi:hypothetical protein
MNNKVQLLGFLLFQRKGKIILLGEKSRSSQAQWGGGGGCVSVVGERREKEIERFF